MVASVETQSPAHPRIRPRLLGGALGALCLVFGGWFVANMVAAARQKAAVEYIENLGAVVWFDYQFDASGREIPEAEPPGPFWLRRILGDDFFTNVTKLHLRDLSDDKLDCLDAFGRLEWLDLTDTQVTDAGLAHVSGLIQLRTLNLRATRVGDAGLDNLRTLKKLQTLDLDGTDVGDAGLLQIAGLPQLRTLNLRGTKVTGEGVQKLQAAWPNCTIRR
jgi:hypothetical protein